MKYNTDSSEDCLFDRKIKVLQKFQSIFSMRKYSWPNPCSKYSWSDHSLVGYFIPRPKIKYDMPVKYIFDEFLTKTRAGQKFWKVVFQHWHQKWSICHLQYSRMRQGPCQCFQEFLSMIPEMLPWAWHRFYWNLAVRSNQTMVSQNSSEGSKEKVPHLLEVLTYIRK